VFTPSHLRYSAAQNINAKGGREYWGRPKNGHAATRTPAVSYPRVLDESVALENTNKLQRDFKASLKSNNTRRNPGRPFIAEVAGQGACLLVGEGNLSFTKSLVEDHSLNPQLIFASVYESGKMLSEDARKNANFLSNSGVEILFGLDATKMERRIGEAKFDIIIFQFPNAGSREPKYGHNPNYILLRNFLKNCKRHIKNQGRILVTTVDNAYYDGRFRLDDVVEHAELATPFAMPFSPDDYPSYEHVNTIEDEESALSKYKRFSTWVFGV
jgi:hypothetical protein